jgi:hypothetical protein
VNAIPPVRFSESTQESVLSRSLLRTARTFEEGIHMNGCRRDPERTELHPLQTVQYRTQKKSLTVLLSRLQIPLL